MRYEYRIKVGNCNNGKKHYIPQVGEVKILGGRIPYLWMQWNKLIPTFNPISKEVNGVSIGGLGQPDFRCSSEQEAEEIINFHKEKMERIKGEEIKNVYFIKK